MGEGYSRDKYMHFIGFYQFAKMFWREEVACCSDMPEISWDCQDLKQVEKSPKGAEIK